MDGVEATYCLLLREWVTGQHGEPRLSDCNRHEPDPKKVLKLAMTATPSPPVPPEEKPEVVEAAAAEPGAVLAAEGPAAAEICVPSHH